MNTNDTARRIAEVNDAMRREQYVTLALSPRLGHRFTRPEGLTLTALLRRVIDQEFPENTASPEHDFAHLMVGGVEVWWKICYQGNPLSEAPRTLVVFLPDEYSRVEEIAQQGRWV